MGVYQRFGAHRLTLNDYQTATVKAKNLRLCSAEETKSPTSWMPWGEKLRAELNSSELDKQTLESKLISFQIYGEEFEALAEEYSRLRREIATKSWALKEFSS